MNKYKIGDKVTVKSKSKIKCGTFEDKDFDYLRIDSIYEDGNYSYSAYKDNEKIEWCARCYKDKDLIPLAKDIPSIFTYKVGDVLVNKYGEREVLAVVGKLVFISNLDDFNRTGYYFTTQEIIRDGYTFKNNTPKEVETLKIGGIKYLKEEVEKALKGIKEIK